MGLGITEIVVIILAIGVLLFGGKKITELARSMGSASGEYKKAKREVERELKEEEAKAQQTDPQVTPKEDPSSPKDTSAQ